eukprot:612074-Amphidinium_carterae.1
MLDTRASLHLAFFVGLKDMLAKHGCMGVDLPWQGFSGFVAHKVNDRIQSVFVKYRDCATAYIVGRSVPEDQNIT